MNLTENLKMTNLINPKRMDKIAYISTFMNSDEGKLSKGAGGAKGALQIWWNICWILLG